MKQRTKPEARSLLKGAWLSIATPTALWLLAVAAEKWSLPNSLAFALGLVAFFGGLAHLVRTQFAFRHKQVDVASSFIAAAVLGITLVLAIILGLWVR